MQSGPCELIMGRDVIGLGNAEPDAIGPQPDVTGELPLKVGEFPSATRRLNDHGRQHGQHTRGPDSPAYVSPIRYA